MKTKRIDSRGSMAAARATVTLDVSGLEEIAGRFKFIKSTILTVGVQGQDGLDTYKDTGANVASVAMYNEFGTPAGPRHAGIPARSFLRSSVFENRDKIQNKFAKSMAQVFGADVFTVGGRGDPITELGNVGAVIVGMVRDKIRTSGSWAKPNAPATVKKKGFDFPLIETLKLRDSISWAVRIGGQITAKGKAF